MSVIYLRSQSEKLIQHARSIVVDVLEHKQTTKNTIHTFIYCNYGRRKEQTFAALLSSLLL